MSTTLIAKLPTTTEKFTLENTTLTPALENLAEEYALNYEGTFPFMVEMQAKAIKYGLSPKQVCAVLNCMRAEAAFLIKKQTAVKVVQSTAPAVKMLPIGTYTVAFLEGTRVTVKIQSLDAEELDGWDFYAKGGYTAGSMKIKVLTGPDNENSYTCIGVQKQDGTMKFWKKAANYERATDAVQALLDPETAKTAGYEYAVKSSRCYRCNHKLTVPASICAGLGPDCASKV